MSNMGSVALVCFRRDLRLADNPALRAAVDSGLELLPVFIWDAEFQEKLGSASKWWLHHSLVSLKKSLNEMGSDLRIEVGQSSAVLARLCRDFEVTQVIVNKRYEPDAIKDDLEVKKALPKSVSYIEFKGHLLWEPDEVRNLSGQPYKVYTAFWNAIQKLRPPAPVLPAPKKITSPLELFAKSKSVEDLKLLPTLPWDKNFYSEWTPGEHGAHKNLNAFNKKTITDYRESRNIPSVHGTSSLSPYMAWGEISSRQIWHAVLKSKKGPYLSEGEKTYLKEIVWREFSHHLLFHFPFLVSKPLREEFLKFPWKKNEALLKKWQRGQTGFPIVDAGMRELWHTGWMHNRVRMIVASFLIKNLMIHWKSGAEWFWDTLVDADVPNNTLSWQWVAGCGVDASPFFRIFNPVLQGEKFDPNGDYVKKWCPELKGLPKNLVHTPSSVDAGVLAAAGVRLGDNYPKPCVDLKLSRDLALQAFKELRK